jgi:hypothetical protein
VGESVAPSSDGDLEHIRQIMFAMERDEIDLPHVVVTTVAACGSATYSGPYADGLEALSVAQAEHQADIAAGGTGDVRYSVAALYPAVDLREPYDQAAVAFAEPDRGTDGG